MNAHPTIEHRHRGSPRAHLGCMWTDTSIRTDRDVKIEALQERLTTAVESLVTGDDWRKAVEFSARFRSRSFRNSALIASQHLEAHQLGLVPDPFPTYVAGFKQWQSLGRRIAKGQHGIGRAHV